MRPTTQRIAGLAILPAVALVLWAWFVMARVDEDLRTFNGFEGLHLEA